MPPYQATNVKYDGLEFWGAMIQTQLKTLTKHWYPLEENCNLASIVIISVMVVIRTGYFRVVSIERQK